VYEPEVNDITEPIEVLPLVVRHRFSEFRDKIVSRTLLPWGEHCTECVWPTCYTTCELYSPRQDGACRQFVDGAVRIDHKEGASPYLLKIRFKQWAKLWTVGNLRLESMSIAAVKERYHIAVGSIGRNLIVPAGIKRRALQKINYLRRTAAENAQASVEPPDSFLLECFNPASSTVSLTFTVRLRARERNRPFQKKIDLLPGYTRTKIAFSEISQVIDFSEPFEIEMVPNESEDKILYFGLMDFVRERHPEPTKEIGLESAIKPIKCIVWDLDNTLWDGILIEDGLEKIRLRQDTVDLIRKLDQKGILHSIASKNNQEEAIQALRALGIVDLFLYPQINWQPKSQSIERITKLLNIGNEAIVFVDDQPFEREEVKSAFPSMTVIDSIECARIPDLPGCRLPVTEESKNRRLMYREQEQRDVALQSYQGDYIAFLRDCRIEIDIESLDESNLQRVYELAQRTNQMNFSGKRYSVEELLALKASTTLETYVVAADDRFGKYGIIGFGVVDSQEPRLLDLMFSCRIQSKRVEHAVLSFLLKRFVLSKKQDLHANYRRTPKNAPSGKVFEEVGFEFIEEKDGISSLVFRVGCEVPNDQIIQLSFRESA